MDRADGLITLSSLALGDTHVIAGDCLKCLMRWAPRPGSAVTVTGGDNNFARARVVELAAGRATLLVYELLPAPAESPLEIIILQAMPDKERLELIIEKAAELGADMIVPWKAEKGVGLAERKGNQPKDHRFQKRALKAARQCRRGKVPAIMPFTDLASAMDLASHAGLKLLLSEKPSPGLRETLKEAGNAESVAIISGPEGGFTRGEIEAAREKGFVAVSLGARVLRAETAPVVAAAIVQYELGDLGSATL